MYYDDAAMPFMSADIDGADKSTEGLRERTPSWAERVMTLDEIDDYLVKHVELRRNVITSRMEIRWFADDIPRGLEPWKELTDYEFNKLWRRMQRIKDVSERHLHQEIESDFSPDFHPFRDYLEHLPPWDGKADHIAILTAGVTVEGGEREQQSFCATGNHPKFLNDPTGTRRWLPFKLDAAFADLGFEEKTVNGMSGYLAVRRKPEEIEALARLMAQDAKQQPPKT